MFRSYYLEELLTPSVSIYYSRDNLMAVPYFYRHGRVLEPRLMKKSTLVCANSAYLAKVARQYNPHSFDVGQGCDLSVFDPAGIRGVPEDIAAIKGPIIGFIGALLSYRLDVPLLEELCKKKGEWSWVFVGKEDEGFQQSSLHGLANVHFLGLKKESQLPSYLAHFDVAINPQSINDMTVGNYPRKIDEYLAMGKPTVATATDTMELFRDHVYMGKGVEEYIELIGKALQDKDPVRAHKRILFARSHTWENSVLAICRAIREVRPGIA
jgi:glycosyltransferase involved in cell wall biosynthesis